MNIMNCPKCGNEPIKILIDRKLQRTCCGATFESDKDWNKYCLSLEFTSANIEYDIIEELYRQIWKDNKSKNAKVEIEKCYHEILNLKDTLFTKIKRKQYTTL